MAHSAPQQRQYAGVLQSRLAQGGGTSALAPLLRRSFWVFVLPLAFDFKAESSNGPVQIALFVLSTLGFLAFVKFSKWLKYPGTPLTRALILWWCYLLSTVFVAALSGVDLSEFTRNILPFLLLGEALLVGTLLIQSSNGAHLMLKAFFVCSLISTLWRFLYAILFRGVIVDAARHQIVSPLTVPMVVTSFALLLFHGRRERLPAVLGLLIGLPVLFLSVTRTYLLGVIVGLVACALAFLFSNRREERSAKASQVKRFALLALICVVAVASFAAFSDSFFTRWNGRLATVGQQDPTSLSRIAEADGEWTAMTSGALPFILGSGIGSAHVWNVNYVAGIPDFRGAYELNHALTTVGHIAWVYQFYASGILFGWVLPYLMLRAIFFGLTGRSCAHGRVAAIVLVADLFVMSSGNLMGDRISGLFIGLLIALCFYPRLSHAPSPVGKQQLEPRLAYPLLRSRDFSS